MTIISGFVVIRIAIPSSSPSQQSESCLGLFPQAQNPMFAPNGQWAKFNGTNT